MNIPNRTAISLLHSASDYVKNGLVVTPRGDSSRYLISSHDGFGTGIQISLPPMVCRLDASCLLEIVDGVVFGAHMLLFSPSSHVLMRGGYSYSHNWASSLAADNGQGALQVALTNPVRLPGRALVLGMCSHYGHMFVDLIDRCYSGDFVSSFDYFVVDELSEFSEWYLTHHLNIDLGKVIQVKNRAIQFDSIVCGENFSKKPFWSLRTVRELQALSRCGQSSSHGGRLFITRERASKRRLSGLPALKPVMSALHFTTIDTSDIDMPTQIGMFNSANVVVGPIGTDLFNLAFCRPGTRVVCLCNNEYFKSGGDNVKMIRSLATCLSLQLTFLLCDSDRNHHDSDLVVDRELLVNIVSLLGG